MDPLPVPMTTVFASTDGKNEKNEIEISKHGNKKEEDNEDTRLQKG
jgi:hypothetical protein